jgi:hypothetical protein
MPITIFDSLYDTRPQLLETWDELKTRFNSPVITKDKYGAWMYSAAVFIPGTTRSNANVQYCSILIADIDKSSPEAVNGLCEVVEENNIEAAFHTTHSYKSALGDGVCKSRILFTLSRDVEPHEWDPLWCGFQVFIENVSECKLDPQCRDPSHAYFAPSAERPEDCLVWFFEGEPLDVDFLLELSPKEPREPSAFRAPSPEVLSRVESSVRYQLAKRLLEAMAPAIEGDGGDNRTFVAACVGHDYALTEEEFWPLLVEYNKRCRPPWNEDELAKKLENAYKYSSLPQGWRLVGEGQDDIVEEEDIKKLVTRMLKSERKAPLGRTMRSMLNGSPLISHDPKQTLMKIGRLLGDAFPQAFPKQLAGLFEKSIEATEAEGEKDASKRFRDVTLDALMTHIRTAQEDHQAQEAARRLQIQDVLALKYARAFRAIDVARATPYTDDEIVKFREEFDRHEGDKIWIVRHCDSYYFRVDDQYVGPFGSDAWNAAATYLSPVPDLSLYDYTQYGRRPRSMASLVEEYGVVAHQVIVDMARQKSRYDPDTFTMYEAPCPIRTKYIQPHKHDNVDRWILLLCGCDTALYERLLDWLASMLTLRQPTAALVLYGKAQTGKSLMGNALSRLFTTAGATEIEDVSGNFNSKLAKCPVTMADETVPQENRQPNTRLLRKLITAHQRTFRRKFIPDAELIGAMRLIMTANNLEGLISFENVTEHDVEALCERFLLIKIDSDAPKLFLDSLSPAEREEITRYHAIAEHVLWLSENRKVTPGSRLLVEGFQDSELRRALRSGTGVRPEVVEFVGNWVIGKQLHRTEHHPLVHILQDGTPAALMTVHTLKEHWKSLVGDNVPRLTQLRKALEALSEPKQVRVQSRNYWQLDMAAIKDFALMQGFDEAQFDTGLRNLGLLPKLPVGTLPIK